MRGRSVRGEPGPRLMAALQIPASGEPVGVSAFLAEAAATMVVAEVSEVARGLPGDVVKWL